MHPGLSGSCLKLAVECFSRHLIPVLIVVVGVRSQTCHLVTNRDLVELGSAADVS